MTPMTAICYGIKHKKTGLFFGGFDQKQMPVWVTDKRAYAMTEESAKMQAMLLRIGGDLGVQIKPVKL